MATTRVTAAPIKPAPTCLDKSERLLQYLVDDTTVSLTGDTLADGPPFEEPDDEDEPVEGVEDAALVTGIFARSVAVDPVLTVVQV